MTRNFLRRRLGSFAAAACALATAAPAFALKAKLLYRPHTAVVSVPIHTHGDHTEEQ